MVTVALSLRSASANSAATSRHRPGDFWRGVGGDGEAAVGVTTQMAVGTPVWLNST